MKEEEIENGICAGDLKGLNKLPSRRMQKICSSWMAADYDSPDYFWRVFDIHSIETSKALINDRSRNGVARCPRCVI
eukprot:scaffold43076_cov139-Skeletonema_dohrnii-CCMP3373.AAC.1